MSLTTMREEVRRILQDKGIGQEFEPQAIDSAINMACRDVASVTALTLTPVPTVIPFTVEDGRGVVIPGTVLKIVTVST